jgi:predicted enzyme related to lactoylglutathione lyase
MSTIQPVIVTADLDPLLAFYTQLFDAEQIFREPAEGPAFYLGLRIGDTDLGLVTRPDAPTSTPSGTQTATPPGTPARIVLSIAVDDVAAALTRVPPLGGSVTGGPTDMPWGQRVAHITDPAGNPLNLTQPVPAR